MSQENNTEQEQADYGSHVIWRLVGSTITSFGANQAGEMYLSTNKGDEFIIGKDEAGEICLFEVERKVVSHE
jgi:hypothetical protein